MGDRTTTQVGDRWESKMVAGELTEGWAKDSYPPVGMGSSQFCSHPPGSGLAQNGPALPVMSSSGVDGQSLQKISGGQASEESTQSVVFLLVELRMAVS